MKVLVTGVQGQLGYDVCRELDKRGIEYYGTDAAEMNITDREAVQNTIGEYWPDLVIHCAAYTAVDRAEDESELAFAVNETGTRNIAEACATIDAKMIYISTDYVFSGAGKQCYETDDPTGPLSVYGKSKLAGEQAVRNLLKKYFIVRVSWVFGINGSNFVKTMLRLAETKNEVGVVADQFGAPTYTVDLAKLLCDMGMTERYGTYHAPNSGECSWADFAEEIFRIAGKSVRVRRLTTEEYPAKARRPLNSRLSQKSLIEAGFSVPPLWQDALQRFWKELEK